ncbi:hypothetical protein T484DRAFT_2520357 [Baffinella frigidus]|nr:hypothetical protein T484DRAFT_2520357 [Cryptophyta sp. CCMP2293]
MMRQKRDKSTGMQKRGGGLLLLALAGVLLAAPAADAEAVGMVDATSLEAAVEAHGHVLVMFTTPWCGKCRQTGSNFKWAAEQLEGVEGVGGKTVLLAFLDLDKEDNESAALLKLRFGVTTLPALLWLQQGHDAKPFDGAATANGILEWVRAKFAKPALVPGTVPTPSTLNPHLDAQTPQPGPEPRNLTT